MNCSEFCTKKNISILAVSIVLLSGCSYTYYKYYKPKKGNNII